MKIRSGFVSNSSSSSFVINAKLIPGVNDQIFYLLKDTPRIDLTKEELNYCERELERNPDNKKLLEMKTLLESDNNAYFRIEVPYGFEEDLLDLLDLLKKVEGFSCKWEE